MSGGRSIAWSITGGRRPPATPDGSPLVFEVSCPSGENGRHEVTLSADWSLHTSAHDLVAERVLAAFGGSSPCLQLEKATLAGRTWLEMELRHAIPRLTGNEDHATPTVKATCCRMPLPLSAATGHVRSISHLANVYDVDPAQLREVIDGLATAYGIRHGNAPHPDEAREAQHCVHPPLAVHPLWDLGLSPTAIRRIYDAVNGSAWSALPQSLYVAVVLQRPDLRWLEQTVQAAPPTDSPDETAHLAQWLIETRTALDRRHPRARQEWLATGLPWPWILKLSEAGYVAADLERLVAGTRFTPLGIARILARWAAAGCHPTPDELLRMRALGVGYNDEHVSAPVVGRIRELLAADGITLPDTQLGLMFVAAGSAVMAHAWVQAGVTDPFRIAELIAAGESPRSVKHRSIVKRSA